MHLQRTPMHLQLTPNAPPAHPKCTSSAPQMHLKQCTSSAPQPHLHICTRTSSAPQLHLNCTSQHHNLYKSMFNHKIRNAPLSTSEVHPTPGALRTSQHLCSSREYPILHTTPESRIHPWKNLYSVVYHQNADSSLSVWYSVCTVNLCAFQGIARCPHSAEST